MKAKKKIRFWIHNWNTLLKQYQKLFFDAVLLDFDKIVSNQDLPFIIRISVHTHIQTDSSSIVLFYMSYVLFSYAVILQSKDLHANTYLW
jgi:hypothetical protein